MSRIENHIILGDLEEKKMVTIIVDGKEIPAVEGEPILSALLAEGIFLWDRALHKLCYDSQW